MTEATRAVWQSVPIASAGAAQHPLASWVVDVDDAGEPLVGARAYVIRLARELASSAAGWSIVMHDVKCLPTGDPAQRVSIGPHQKLAFAADGALEIFAGAQSPGPGRETNWLPAPDGPFHLVLNLHGSQPLSAQWPPAPPARIDSRKKPR
jgi:hypothetical protein